MVTSKPQLASRTCNKALPQQESFNSSLKLCIDLYHGKIMHAHIVEIYGFQQDRFIENMVIDMYGRFGALKDALCTFSSIPDPNVFSWNLMMRAFVNNRHSHEALSLFEKMKFAKNIRPDRVSFLTCISACADLKDLNEARKMESCLFESDLNLDLVLHSALMNMYHKCCSLEDALRIFGKTDKADVVCWNTIISAYSEHGFSDEAFFCFDVMIEENVSPTHVTYTTLFNLCANQKWLAKGRHLHACLKNKNKMESSIDLDMVLGNALINMYGKCNSLDEAREVFDEMSNRNCVTWGTMITEYASQMHGNMAIQLFYQMHMESTMPDMIVRTNTLCACATLPDPGLGKHIHASLCPLFMDVIVGTALINMYGKCKLLEHAETIFDYMSEHDVISHNAMLTSFIHCEEKMRAIQHFQQMLQEGIGPVEITFTMILDACSEGKLAEGKFAHACIVGGGSLNINVDITTALITFYGKHGMLKHAGLVFDELSEKDVIAWNAMIAACARQCHHIEGFKCFHQMQMECFIPNCATFASSLSACVTEASLVDGKRMHACIVGASMESDIVVGTSLIHMYGKCGSLDHAKLVLDVFPHRTVVTWNTLISVYAQHGQGKMALEVFHDMESKEIRPDKATFSCVLSACSHGGYVDEGLRCFLSMLQVHGIRPTIQHFNCIINLLSRAGRLEEGESLVSFMPSQPVDTLWTTLLSACRMHLDVKRANRLANQMKQVSFESDSTSLLIANIFASPEREGGDWDLR